MLSHESAAELWNLPVRPGRPTHVTVPASRCPPPIPGLIIHRSRQAARIRHPSRLPPLTRIDDTIIDLTQSADNLEEAISWLTRAVGGRVTTPARLRDCLDGRARLRWRELLSAALVDVEAGCHSPLELAYLRKVERAHRLPRSHRQARRNPTRHDSGRYDDVRYVDYATRVELDGRAAHPEHKRWRDMRRDNAAAEEGDHVLRYGSADVNEHPCRVAAQVATVLRAGGWTGSPHRCGKPGCQQ